MSLSCNVDSAPQDNHAYSWYKDHKKINTVQKIHHIPSADWNAAGSYQCQAETGDKSDPVRLNITDEVVILQAPPSVFEGDNITLRCHSLSVQGAENTTFYKDGQIVGSGTSELTLQAELNSTGNYKCAKPVTRHNSHQQHETADRQISVTELFPPPRVSISVDPVVEGAEMRVTCATLPQRAKTSLEFAFNRNGRKVQEFSSSDTYSVQSAQEDDAGNYTCEAKTSSSSVKKRSRTHRVTVKESFSRPQIKVSPDQVTEGDTVTMMCSAVNTKQEFAFYRNGQEVQGFGPSGEYQVQSVQEGDTGSYTCQVTYLPNGLKKRSDAHHVYVKELFSFPVLTITPAQVTEGDTMTVTCDAALRTSAGNNTQLEFAFSRDGGDLRGFTVSNKYHVDTAQTQDAGNYSCEARTTTNKVRKKSHVTNVHISAPGTWILKTALIVSFLVVTALITLLWLLRHRLTAISTSHVNQHLPMEPGSEQVDVCYAPVLINRTCEAAPDTSTDNGSIIYAEVTGNNSMTKQRNR